MPKAQLSMQHLNFIRNYLIYEAFIGKESYSELNINHKI